MMNIPQETTHKTLAEVQNMFTQHIRDPEHRSAPDDIEERRMEIYRSSIYLNIERVVSNFFPVLKKVLPDDQWHNMVKDYFKRHRSRVSPFLPRLGQEFLEYLEHERDLKDDPGFILELAHYEWIEFSLSIDVREIEMQGIDPKGDLLKGIPVMSPLALPLSYRYPVHRISPDNQPDQAPNEPTYLVVYRDLNDKIGFIKLNPVSACLLEHIREGNNITGQTLLETIATKLRHPNPGIVIQGGAQIMQQLYDKNVILGTLEK